MVAFRQTRSDPGPGLALRARSALRRSLRKWVVRGAINSFGVGIRLSPIGDPRRHDILVERNLGYRDAQGRAHELDVFRPARCEGPLPVVFYVHGGGFSMLSKDTHWGMAMTFARKGYLVININYRLAPKHSFPSPLMDVCAAFEWAVENAGHFGGDLDRLVFAGESAGANLITALTVATTFERPEPYARRVFDLGVVPQAAVPACGILQVTDVERFWRRRPDMPLWIRAMLHDVSSGYLGALRVQPSAELELADPLRVFESDAKAARTIPRFFIPVGTKDPILDDTRRLAKALSRRGVEHSERYYPGEVHAFHAMIWREQARECWREKFEFLKAVLDADQAHAA